MFPRNRMVYLFSYKNMRIRQLTTPGRVEQSALSQIFWKLPGISPLVMKAVTTCHVRWRS